MEPKEIKREIEQNNLKTVWLENAAGTVVYPKNRIGVKPLGHLDNIFNLLNTQALPNGVYYVCAKFSMASRVEPCRYQINKGMATLSEGGPVDRSTSTNMQIESPMFNAGQFIQLNADLASCKAENNFYRQQIARLEMDLDVANERINELLDKVSDGQTMQQAPTPTLMEQLPALLTSAAPFAPVLAAMFTKQLPVTPEMPTLPLPINQPQPTLADNDTNQKNINDDNQSNLDVSGRLEMLFQSNPAAFDRFVEKYYTNGNDDDDNDDADGWAGLDEPGNDDGQLNEGHDNDQA
jgi:hypothetical protein